MKLGLGSAQFGLDYGISNKEGQTPESEVKKILSLASEQKLSVIDTASEYGNSEDIIGTCLPDTNPFRIVTKTPSFNKEFVTEEDALFLKETLFASLNKLGQKSLYGLLIHNADNLLSKNGALLWQAMQELKSSGLVEKIGVSVYSPDQLDAVLSSFQIDLVQLPVNVLDQRMLNKGYLKRLKELNIEIHSRSVFLQGLLLMNPGTLPAYFSNFRNHLKQYHEFLKANRITPAEAAITFVFGIPEIDTVIIGVNNTHQLLELCELIYLDSMSANIDFSAFATEDKTIINPTYWR